jgi:hypothetical protein
MVNSEANPSRSNKPLLISFTILYALLAAALLGGSYYTVENILRQQIVQLGETSNIALAQGFGQTLWPRFGEYVKTVPDTDGDALRGKPETAQLRQLSASLAKGKPVLKLKIYNLDGLTVYSSEESQIGESKRGNLGFEQAAKEGLPASKMSERGRFSGFADVISNVALAETYVPVRNIDGEVEGVFELYTNVSPVFDASRERLRQFMLMLGAVCAVGYVILLLMLMALGRRPRSHTDDEQQNQQAQSLRQQMDTLQQQLTSKEQELQMLRRYVADRSSTKE